ncbi:MAG: tRNA 2-thiouridine(34) synthase MnmA [Bacillota bacterium]
MRVILGLSGGVDSSVAAKILLDQGHEVIGVFMKNWEEQDENGRCTSDVDYEDAKSVANSIGIPFYSVNYAKEYYENVFTYFLESYKAGKTPNPDVLCNREVKFGPFLKFAKSIGGDMIATGHYVARTEIDGLVYLKMASDKNKDQSYFLNQLSYAQASSCLFPLADIEKPEVRKIADELSLATAEKKDSTGICFIGERNFRKFLQNYLPAKSGKMCTLDGKVIGEHIGLMYYTIGQRRGLNIGGVKGYENGRWFVLKKDLEKNILYVQNGDGEELVSRKAKCDKFNFITKKPEVSEFSCLAKFRYRGKSIPATAKIADDGSMEVFFPTGDRAVTCGQYAVLYCDETWGEQFEGVMLGGGEIDKVWQNA